MPFIDLKDQNNDQQTGNVQAAQVAQDDQTTDADMKATATTSVPQNVTADDQSGVREISGADFPNQESAQDSMQTEAAAPVEATPEPEPQQDLSPAQQDAGGDVEIEIAGTAQEEEHGASENPEMLTATPSEADVSIEKSEVAVAQQPDQLPQEPQPVAQPNQPSAPPQAAAPENRMLQDMMDRTLPKLEVKKPQPKPQIGTPEEGINHLKTVEEQVALESRTYQLDELLRQMVKIGASDLHLSAGYRAMARVDGKLQMMKSQVMTHESIMNMLEPIAKQYGNLDFKNSKDMDFSYGLEDTARFRVNVGYQRRSMMATFRQIPSEIKTPEELKLPPIAKEFTKFKQGLVLVTGPTGSGKTTTLAALVNKINMTEPYHIITIEDPVEYTYPKGAALVDQRSVGVDTNKWSDALRAALRQDPDVVLIGEMRDVETMEAALQVAETGHLVFSTLHTNTAAQTIDRVIDAFPEMKQSQVRTQLATTLMAVISQRLLPVSGGGRRIAVEVMVVTPAVRNAIREGKVFQIDNMIQTGAEFGMITMEKSLSTLVREGYISTELAQRFANKPEDLMSQLSKGGMM